MGPSRNTTYQLYGVSNHYGTLGGGHYTAFCKHVYSDMWYNFDDSQVSHVADVSHICSNAAYVVFYTSVDFKMHVPAFGP